MYEVFSRLNTGGINLRPQEIRTSMYHSSFFDMLYRINQEDRWRNILQSSTPDLHMKDIEVLLRGFAMLVSNEDYSPSMVRFLNQFSRKSESNTVEQNRYLEELFLSFLDSCGNLPPDAFINKRNKRFNIALFEAVFTATCEAAFKARRVTEGNVEPSKVAALSSDPAFTAAALQGTTGTSNVETRLNRARELVGSL